jgi:DNA-binding NtrC family response regulator
VLLAIDLEEIIVAHGGEVLNSVPSVALALAAIKKRRPDAVILDRNLDGEPTDAVVEALVDGGIPFVVVSGYGAQQTDNPSLRDAPFVKKPYDPAALVGCLATILS